MTAGSKRTVPAYTPKTQYITTKQLMSQLGKKRALTESHSTLSKPSQKVLETIASMASISKNLSTRPVHQSNPKYAIPSIIPNHSLDANQRQCIPKLNPKSSQEQLQEIDAGEGKSIHLSPEQQYVYDLVIEKRISVFFTGSAGI